MIRAHGVPYRTASAGHVHLDPWQLLVSGGAEALPASLPQWDYGTDLSLRRGGTIDSVSIRKECGLAESDRLRLAAVWQTRGSALRGLVCTMDLPPAADSYGVLLEGKLSGRELAGTLDITTCVFLADPRTSTAPLSAARAGSTLWEDTASVAIEGTAARFPIQIVDFTDVLGVPAGAAWYLESAHMDFHRSFLGSVRLLLNMECEGVVRAASTQTPTAEDRAIRSAIYYDVGRMLVRRALSDDEFLENPGAFAVGTVGSTLFALLTALFPGDSPAVVKNRMVERPEYFDSELQAKLRLFRG